MEWIEDRGRDDIPADHIGMVEYLGALPTGDVSEPGYGQPNGQAFMVEMGGDTDPLRTHFHVVDQFQVFVHGSGTVGRHPVGHSTVHYADRFTPYGPLVADPSGLSYVTLRSISDTGAYYMPDERDALRDGLDSAQRSAGTRRNLTFDLAPPSPADDGTDHDATPVGVIHADDDGLAVSVADLAPGATTTLSPFGGAGAFAVVLTGALIDTAAHGPGALTFSNAGEALTLTAGDEATRVAILQLPA